MFHVASLSTEVNFKARAVKPFVPPLFLLCNPAAAAFGLSGSRSPGRRGERQSAGPGGASKGAAIPRAGGRASPVGGGAAEGSRGQRGPAGAAPPLARRCPRC